MNSMFELATQDEIDKLKAGDSSSANKSSEELQLDDLEVYRIILKFEHIQMNKSILYFVL